MKILVTGFEPFGNEKTNPSWEAVKLLPDLINGSKVIKAKLPVVFDSCYKIIGDLIKNENPEAVLHIGQAGGRTCITPEFVAINQRNGIDNADREYRDQKVIIDGPDAYFATLPVRQMTDKLIESNIPAKISYSAGTYVCNNLMYSSLHYIAIHKLNIPSGFIHIPYSAEQAAAHNGKYAFMDIKTAASGIEKCISVIADC